MGDEYKQTTLRLLKETHAKFKSLCSTRNTDMQEAITEFVNAYLDSGGRLDVAAMAGTPTGEVSITSHGDIVIERLLRHYQSDSKCRNCIAGLETIWESNDQELKDAVAGICRQLARLAEAVIALGRSTDHTQRTSAPLPTEEAIGRDGGS
jgi:hypothetical protein